MPSRPDFLIVGAMKAGTTTLWQDLLLNEAIFFPRDKEPDALASDDVLSEPGRQRYAAMFADARADQVCGEASTIYTKMPYVTGCAQRARRVVGEHLKVIYIVREPVARIISHYRHEHTRCGMTGDIDAAVRQHPRLIDYSRYAMQIRPWIETFGRESVRIIRFEDYVAARQSVVGSISEWLGVVLRTEKIDVEQAYNRSEAKPVGRGLWLGLAHAGWYRRMIRPLLSHSLRRAVRHTVLPRVSDKLASPSRETVAFIIDQLQEDVLELQRIVEADHPFWDLSRVLDEYSTAEIAS